MLDKNLKKEKKKKKSVCLHYLSVQIPLKKKKKIEGILSWLRGDLKDYCMHMLSSRLLLISCTEICTASGGYLVWKKKKGGVEKLKMNNIFGTLKNSCLLLPLSIPNDSWGNKIKIKFLCGLNPESDILLIYLFITHETLIWLLGELNPTT